MPPPLYSQQNRMLSVDASLSDVPISLAHADVPDKLALLYLTPTSRLAMDGHHIGNAGAGPYSHQGNGQSPA